MSGSVQMRIKQGATFSATLNFYDANGLPLDLEAGVLTAALLSATRVSMAGLGITPDPATPGQAFLLADATSTATWPLGALRGDVKFVTGSGTQYSETFLLFVDGAITP